MKKSFKLIVLSLACLAVGLMPTLVGCKKSRSENDLEIRYYSGGFGSEWIKYAANEFEKANKGVKVKLVADPELQTSINTYLGANRNLSDLYFTQSIDWQYYVRTGKVEPLDDLYDTEVAKKDGTKIKIKDYLIEERQEVGKMKVNAAAEAHQWILPWSTLNCGMVYNEKIILKTPRRSTGANWAKAPETMSELYEYVDDLNAAGLKSGDGTNVQAFAIGIQKGQWWLTFPLKVWWAQIQGVADPSVIAQAKDQGSFYDFWDFGAPEYSFGANGEKNVWNQTGIAGGLDILRSLLTDKDGHYTNTIDKCDQIEAIQAEQAFAQGKAAFIFVGNWIENEIGDFVTDECEMKAMYVPTVDESINEKTGVDYIPAGFEATKNINNNAEMDLALVPAAAPNKELAKQFLAFINSEEMLIKFTEQTGCARPFNYNPLNAAGVTEYAKSAIALSQNASYNLIEYPMNKGHVAADKRDDYISYIYTYKRPQLFQNPDSGYCLGHIIDKTGSEIMGEVVEKTNTLYKEWFDELQLGEILASM